jgi:hypothetical protein
MFYYTFNCEMYADEFLIKELCGRLLTCAFGAVQVARIDYLGGVQKFPILMSYFWLAIN